MSKALAEAARIGDLNKVNELLMQEDVIKSVTENDNEELRYTLLDAAKNGHLAVVKRLLQVSTVSDHPNALLAAAILGDLDTVNILLKTPRTVEDITSAVGSAAGRGHLPIVDLLLSQFLVLVHSDDVERQIRSSENYRLGLINAAGNGHLAVVLKLCEFCPEVFYEYDNFKEMLSAAAGGGHLEIVNHLLEVPGALENIDLIKSPLLEAASRGQVAVADLLLELLLELEPGVFTDDLVYVKKLLDRTVAFGQRAVFDRLLQIPQFSDELAASGDELLSLAIREFQLEMVVRLLQIAAVQEKIAGQQDTLIRKAIKNVGSKNGSFTAFTVRGSEESSASAILYLLIRTYQALGIELPSDLEVEGGSLVKFLKDYQEKLDKVKEILLNLFSEIGIIGIIDEYDPMILFNEFQAKFQANLQVIKGVLHELFPEDMVKIVDNYALILGMLDNRKSSHPQQGVLRPSLARKPEALYPIKLVSTTSSSAGVGSTFVYEMSDESEKSFSEEQPLGRIEAKTEQERLEQVRIFQLKTQLTSELVQENPQLEAIHKAFSVLFSKENFMGVSYCFTQKNVLEALRQEPTLKPFRMHIDTLESLGQIEESDFESVLSENGPSNHSLRENIKRLYQEQRNLAKDLVRGNETVQEPTVTSVASTSTPPTPIQELYYNLHLINSLRYKPTENDKVEQAILRIQELQGSNYFKLNETIIPGIEKILGQEVNRILAGHVCLDRVVSILSQEPSTPSIEDSSASVDKIEILTEERREMDKKRWLDRVAENAESAYHQNKAQASDTQAISESSPAGGSPMIHFAYSTSGASKGLKRSGSEPSLTTKRAVQVARHNSLS